MKSLRVGIVGASGYSGEVLMELLSRHPRVEGLVVASRSLAGKEVSDCMPRLRGVCGDLRFVESEVCALSQLDVPVWFLALPHGVAAEFAGPLEATGSLVIDLSADFRLHSVENYERWYGSVHAMADRLATIPYVFPEWGNRDWVGSARLLACPGCYPTSVLLPLLPLVREGILELQGIQIHSMSGVSGAGKKAAEFYSFCERESSVVAYGLGGHRHLGEIEEQLSFAAGTAVSVQFIPHLVPMNRGIASTITVRARGGADAIRSCWTRVYGTSAAVDLLPGGVGAETGDVVGKNRIAFSATDDPRNGTVIICSAIDNLLKGASGQAVQILNLWMGWPEMEGLR